MRSYGTMNSSEFREELTKIMPGYDWTIHKPLIRDGMYLSATGIQSSGFNRMSTLQVVRRIKEGVVEYEVKSSGYGTKSPWLWMATDCTIARALRKLQKHYESQAAKYSSHATDLQLGRKAPAQEAAITTSEALKQCSMECLHRENPTKEDCSQCAESPGGQDRESYTDTQDRENYTEE